MFYILLPSPDCRQALIEHLKAQTFSASFTTSVTPLNHGRRVRRQKKQCPVTEDISGRLLRLPFFNDLTEGELERGRAAVTAFRG